VVPAQAQLPVRVLVVDDSDVFQHVLSVLVAATPGFEVVDTASSGREALHLIDALDPQLVLVDLQLPELEGIETARRLREQHPDLAVVLLAADRHVSLALPSLVIVDRQDVSPEWLAKFWRSHGDRAAES
jgi:DNA-binding NarL/FixJ family response regulator